MGQILYVLYISFVTFLCLFGKSLNLILEPGFLGAFVHYLYI